MKRTSWFWRTKFPPEIIEAATAALLGNSEPKYTSLSVRVGVEHWGHDDVNDFFADYRRGSSAYFVVSNGLWTDERRSMTIKLEDKRNFSQIEIGSPLRNEIAKTFEIFEQNLSKYQVPRPDKETALAPSVFIGHGRATAWRDLKDHLADQHGYEIIAYETGRSRRTCNPRHPTRDDA